MEIEFDLFTFRHSFNFTFRLRHVQPFDMAALIDVDDLNSSSKIMEQFAKKNKRMLRIFEDSDDDSNGQVS